MMGLVGAMFSARLQRQIYDAKVQAAKLEAEKRYLAAAIDVEYEDITDRKMVEDKAMMKASKP